MRIIRRLGGFAVWLLIVAMLALAGCSPAASADGDSGSSQVASQATPVTDQPAPTAVATQPSVDGPLSDPVLDGRAKTFTATVEYSTPYWDTTYGRAQNIDDGRGITAGPVGFTSGTGDLLEFMRRYNAAAPGNPLAAKYLQALEDIGKAIKDGTGSPDSTKGLEDFIDAWQQTDSDPALRAQFRQVQDRLINDWYFVPAAKRAVALNITTPLGGLILRDAEVQHGGNDERRDNGEFQDPDGTPSMIEETQRRTGLMTVSGIEQEKQWLAEFLVVRVEHLTDADDEATRNKWAESVPRVAALDKFLVEGNLQLQAPFSWKSYGGEEFSFLN